MSIENTYLKWASLLIILTCPPNIDTGEMLQFSWTKGKGYGQENEGTSYCHAGGREFKSRRPRHPPSYFSGLSFCFRKEMDLKLKLTAD